MKIATEHTPSLRADMAVPFLRYRMIPLVLLHAALSLCGPGHRALSGDGCHVALTPWKSRACVDAPRILSPRLDSGCLACDYFAQSQDRTEGIAFLVVLTVQHAERREFFPTFVPAPARLSHPRAPPRLCSVQPA
ncbi:MAG: hypothetical protein U0794_02040 [Isosphaeraceae bacterium]